MVLIDGMLKYFKGPKKDFKHLRMDNSGENQAIARSCKESDMKVEFVPPDAPKINDMVEHGFAIRWETTKTLMQNEGLKQSAMKNKKIIVEEKLTTCLLNK